MRAKPIVDGIEAELGDRGQILRLDIRSEAGYAVAERYNARFTPTFIIFNTGGNIAYCSTGVPDGEQLLQRILKADQTAKRDRADG